VTERTGRALVWAVIFLAAVTAPRGHTDVLVLDLFAASGRLVFAMTAIYGVTRNMFDFGARRTEK
jgi:hypothetical protein